MSAVSGSDGAGRVAVAVPTRRRADGSSGLGQPAGGGLTAAEVEQRRLLDRAPIERHRAARMEAAARRDVRGVGRLALEDRPRRARVPGVGRIGRRRDRHERLGVRVARRADDRLGRPDLHDLAEVHDRDPVGDDPGQRQVVGDEQVGQPALAAQVEHQPQQLGPDRHVEHRDGLVGDDDLGIHDQRPGDDDPLALAAGQLVREADGESRGRAQAGRLERGDDLRLALRPLVPMPLTTSGSATKS